MEQSSGKENRVERLPGALWAIGALVIVGSAVALLRPRKRRKGWPMKGSSIVDCDTVYTYDAEGNLIGIRRN